MSSLLLISGGWDSRLLLREQRHKIGGLLFFDYGQPTVSSERYAVSQMARDENVVWREKKLPTPDRKGNLWLGRNALFIAYAVTWGIPLGFDRFIVGGNRSDWDRLPDCRPAFWQQIREDYAQAYAVSISTPLLHTPKYDIIDRATRAGIDKGAIWTCDRPNIAGKPCGHCLSCENEFKALRALRMAGAKA